MGISYSLGADRKRSYFLIYKFSLLINLKTDGAMGYNSLCKMKKGISMVSMLVVVVMTMAALFVSCKKKGSIDKGCTCTMKMYGYEGEETEFITPQEMKEVADELAQSGVVINTCSDYSDYVMRTMGKEAVGSISCK